MIIGIIGGGRIGTAIAHLMKDHTVLMWDVERTLCNTEQCLEDVVAQSEVLFVCTPTSSLIHVATVIRDHTSHTPSVIILSKGMNEAGQTVFQIVEEILGVQTLVLCGPMMAEDILEGRPAFALCAGTDSTRVAQCVSLFLHTNLTVTGSADPIGVSLLSVAKNIYAVLGGISDGLSLGSNIRGVIVLRAIQEMEQLLTRWGGQRATLYTYAGIGDLVCTLTSLHSRNRTYGEALARGETVIAGEGAKAIVWFENMLGEQISEFPCLRCAVLCMRNPEQARQYLSALV